MNQAPSYRKIFIHLLSSLMFLTTAFNAIGKSPAKCKMSVSISVKPISCPGDEDGSLNVSISKGAPPYQFAWSNGATDQNLYNLSGGLYSLTVIDKKGCKAINQETVHEPVPPFLSASMVTENVLCKGDSSGKITVNTSGGVSPYLYLWSTGDTSSYITGPFAGKYSVTVRDNNGCSVSSSVDMMNDGSLPISIFGKDLNCLGAETGYAFVDVLSGIRPYSYRWSNGDTTKDISNLKVGSYSVTVIDSAGCTAVASVNIKENKIKTSIIPTHECFNGSNGEVDLTVSGGAPAYFYTWNISNYSEDIANLSAGLYEVTVTDNGGCSAIDSVRLFNSDSLIITLSKKNVSSLDYGNGEISLKVDGDAPPFSYEWNNGENTKDIQDLKTGYYEVTVTDKNGCTVSDGINVELH